MNSEEVSMRKLSIAMKVISVFFLLGFAPYIVLVALGSPLIAEGTFLGRLLRWQPYNPAYESMIASIYVAWGVFLWKASVNPKENRIFIDFTIWANVAHAGTMLVGAFVVPGEWIHAFGDVAILGIVAALLLWLRPRAAGEP